MDDPMTDPAAREQFTIDLTDGCKDLDGWLATMRFGMGTLLQNQPLLIECVVRRAAVDAKTGPHHRVADEVRHLFGLLGLKLTVEAADVR